VVRISHISWGLGWVWRVEIWDPEGLKFGSGGHFLGHRGGQFWVSGRWTVGDFFGFVCGVVGVGVYKFYVVLPVWVGGVICLGCIVGISGFRG